MAISAFLGLGGKHTTYESGKSFLFREKEKKNSFARTKEATSKLDRASLFQRKAIESAYRAARSTLTRMSSLQPSSPGSGLIGTQCISVGGGGVQAGNDESGARSASP